MSYFIFSWGILNLKEGGEQKCTISGRLWWGASANQNACVLGAGGGGYLIRMWVNLSQSQWGIGYVVPQSPFPNQNGGIPEAIEG